MKLQSAVLLLILAIASHVIAAGDEPKIIIKDYKFVPQQITIKRGQTLTWENQEKRQYHSVWFKALGEEEPADYIFPGDTYERVFEEVGSFPYRCGPHQEMTGTVHVIE